MQLCSMSRSILRQKVSNRSHSFGLSIQFLYVIKSRKTHLCLTTSSVKMLLQLDIFTSRSLPQGSREGGSCPSAFHSHQFWFREMKARTRRIPFSLSFKDLIARNGSWARLSRGRTANVHQHQAGPFGLIWGSASFSGIGPKWLSIRFFSDDLSE